jgi:WD40 repeat protein
MVFYVIYTVWKLHAFILKGLVDTCVGHPRRSPLVYSAGTHTLDFFFFMQYIEFLSYDYLFRSVMMQGHTGAVNTVSFSPDGNFFSSGGVDQLVMVWKSNLLGIVPEDWEKEKCLTETQVTLSTRPLTYVSIYIILSTC